MSSSLEEVEDEKAMANFASLSFFKFENDAIEAFRMCWFCGFFPSYLARTRPALQTSFEVTVWGIESGGVSHRPWALGSSRGWVLRVRWLGVGFSGFLG